MEAAPPGDSADALGFPVGRATGSVVAAGHDRVPGRSVCRQLLHHFATAWLLIAGIWKPILK